MLGQAIPGAAGTDHPFPSDGDGDGDTIPGIGDGDTHIIHGHTGEDTDIGTATGMVTGTVIGTVITAILHIMIMPTPIIITVRERPLPLMPEPVRTGA